MLKRGNKNPDGLSDGWSDGRNDGRSDGLSCSLLRRKNATPTKARAVCLHFSTGSYFSIGTERVIEELRELTIG